MRKPTSMARTLGISRSSTDHSANAAMIATSQTGNVTVDDTIVTFWTRLGRSAGAGGCAL
jgi:hypothetical protein